MVDPNSSLTISAMVGAMGSGKTTLAIKIARETGALFLSLDTTIKSFGIPIGDLKGYEALMERAYDVIFARAFEALKNGQSVVFDVCRWPGTQELAEAARAKINIYYFNIPTDERWRRVEKRNLEKPAGVYHWTMTREEFDAQNFQRRVPTPMPGLTIIEITE